jgi:hypothetical protein
LFVSCSVFGVQKPTNSKYNWNYFWRNSSHRCQHSLFQKNWTFW